jgi:hypothetical protein
LGTIVALAPWGPLVVRLAIATLLPLVWGWVLWLVRLPSPRLGLALAVGAVVALVAWSRSGLGREPLPRISRVDLVGLGWAGLCALWYAPYAQRTPEGALRVMVVLWDHVSHYWLYRATLTRGVMPMVDGAESDRTALDGLYLSFYPQGYHAALAGIGELLPREDGLDLVVTYLSLATLVHTLLLCAVGWAICGVARRVTTGLVVGLAVVWVTFTQTSSGGRILVDGFPNLWLVCCAVAATPALLLGRGRGTRLLAWLVGGTGAAVALGWVLLVPVAGLVGGATALARRPRTGWWGPALIPPLVIAAVMSVWSVITVLGTLPVSHLNVDGGIMPDGWVKLAPYLASFAVAAYSRRRGARWTSPVVALGLGAAGVLVADALLAGIQLATAGTITYYSLKFGLAGQLIAGGLLATQLALLPRSLSLVRGTALVVAVALSWGLPYGSGPLSSAGARMQAVVTGTEAIGRSDWLVPDIISACRTVPSSDPRPVRVVSRNLAATSETILLGFWVHACARDWRQFDAEILIDLAEAAGSTEGYVSMLDDHKPVVLLVPLGTTVTVPAWVEVVRY